jgi:S1-C subfamily serine protease
MKKFVLGFVSCILMIVATLYACSPNTISVVRNLPRIGSVVTEEKPVHPAIIQLVDEKHGFFCSASVFDNQYAITAAHCLTGAFGGLRTARIIIKDSHGKDTKIRAKAVGINDRIDFGLIKGDFTKFNKVKIDSYHNHFLRGGLFIACGFPQGQNKVSCEAFTPKTNYMFHTVGTSALVPGMSGGPVFDVLTNTVVGVNSAVGEGVVYVVPLVGFLGAFGIE